MVACGVALWERPACEQNRYMCTHVHTHDEVVVYVPSEHNKHCERCQRLEEFTENWKLKQHINRTI